jgi:sulfopyruvate decarboxylase subunit beta
MAMKPEDVLRAIAEHRGDAVCVPTMTTSPAWRTIAPDDLSVTCVGFMGGASSIGLGIALARPERRVVVFDGDGSLLMQLGSLATVAGAAPRNFTHLVFKNGVYHTSGSQGIPGGGDVDFALMAKGAGYRNAYRIDDLEEFRIRLPELLSEDGPVLVELITTEAELTPMTAPGGAPFSRQVEDLRGRLATA